MRYSIYLPLLFVLSSFALFPLYATKPEIEEIIYDIEVEKNQLYSNWDINGVGARVFLETAYPKVIFDLNFILENSEVLDFNLIPAPDHLTIASWGVDKKHKVLYTVKDSITINGVPLKLDAYVVDMASFTNKKTDVIFPIDLISECVEINIKEGYMKFIKSNGSYYDDAFTAYPMLSDITSRKRLFYIQSILECRSEIEKVDIDGLFLLDIGNANAVIFNNFNPMISPFFEQATKTQSKNTGTVNSGRMQNVRVVIPDSLYFDTFIMPQGTFIASVDLFRMKDEKFIGILGNRFFQNFIIRFDFQNEMFYMKPYDKQ